MEISVKIDGSKKKIGVDELQMIYKSPRAQIHSGIAPTEVVCKEGFELLLKTNDGNPACVKESSVSKLIERGWG